jgi:creatinine amidohydrolase
VALSELAWPEAETWLTPSAVVVLPLGAAALEQGRHMTLDADARLARYLAARVQAAAAVVIAPPLNYHFYPAYGEYPGSTSLGEDTARDVVVDAVRSLARSGPRRFYVINTSGSTLAPLSAAARALAGEGILLGYTDPAYWIGNAPVLRQPRLLAGHADEAATSMMLFVDPSAVDMRQAAREYADGRGALTRADSGGVVSKSGTLGDATLATADKGQVLVTALLDGVLGDIDRLRRAPLPAVKSPAPTPTPRRPAVAASPQERPGPNGCTPGDERTIRGVAGRFTYFWAQQDADALAGLFTPSGDIRHPDGSIERGPQVIAANRSALFTRREYAGSKHPLELNDIRCLGTEAALADGKWELRLAGTPDSAARGLAAAAVNSGWCSLVMLKDGNTWRIEAWRYTVNPPAGAPPPVLLNKPGFTTGRGGG